MPVHIDEIESTVDVEPAPAAGGSDASTSTWAALDQMRELMDRAKRDRSRTEARDFDD